MICDSNNSQSRCGPGMLATRRLRGWYHSNLGKLMLELESVQVEHILSNLFGYHLLQVGFLAEVDLLATTRISHCMIVDRDIHRLSWQNSPERGIFAGVPEALPVASDSLDVLVLHHTLEFSPDAHQVLREVDRTLIPEGHVVVLGFNPWSLWGLWWLARGWRGHPPWCGRFIGFARIKDWLSLLGFDIVHTQSYFFRPPLQRDGIMNRLGFMEALGGRFWPLMGGGYLLVAKKRVLTLTQIRPRWRTKRRFISAGVTEP